MIITDLSQIEEVPIGRSIDLTKKIFDNFKVIKRIKSPNKDRSAYWLCQCNCGNYFTSSSTHLTQGACQSCGCLQKEKASKNLSSYRKSVAGKPLKDYTGYRSGKLIVESFSHIDIHHHSVWNCKCDCGNMKKVASPELASKEIKSCGCLQQSYGSYKIEQILIENNIIYEKEKTFNSCRFPESGVLARFDFYIDGVLIEFDGKQHYEWVKGYYSFEDFQNLQKRDEYKNQWCKQNSIPLIRIPYTDEHLLNIEYLKEKIEYGKREIDSVHSLQSRR